MKKYLFLLMLGVAAPAFAQTTLPSDSPAPMPTVTTVSSDATTSAPGGAVEATAPVSSETAAPTSVTVNGVTVAIAPAAADGTAEKAASSEPAATLKTGAPGQEVGGTASSR